MRRLVVLSLCVCLFLLTSAVATAAFSSTSSAPEFAGIDTIVVNLQVELPDAKAASDMEAALNKSILSLLSKGLRQIQIVSHDEYSPGGIGAEKLWGATLALKYKDYESLSDEWHDILSEYPSLDWLPQFDYLETAYLIARARQNPDAPTLERLRALLQPIAGTACLDIAVTVKKGRPGTLTWYEGDVALSLDRIVRAQSSSGPAPKGDVGNIENTFAATVYSDSFSTIDIRPTTVQNNTEDGLQEIIDRLVDALSS